LARSLLAIRRLWFKNTLLSLAVITLGLFLSFSITIRQSILLLQNRVMERVAPIVQLELEYQEGRLPKLPLPIWEMINAVGELPYIRSYNLTFVMYFEDYNHQEYFPYALFEDSTSGAIADSLRVREIFYDTPRHRRDFFGIIQPSPTEFEMGTFHLTEGRFMTQQEITDGSQVILAPRPFAEANGLIIGDTIHMEYSIPPVGMLEMIGQEGIEIFERPASEDMLFHRYLEWEIIGLFDVREEGLIVEDIADFHHVSILYNRFFVPFPIMVEISRESLPARRAWHEWFIAEGISDGESLGLSEELPYHLEAAFILYDSRDLRALNAATNRILPEGWGLVSAS